MLELRENKEKSDAAMRAALVHRKGSGVVCGECLREQLRAGKREEQARGRSDARDP